MFLKRAEVRHSTVGVKVVIMATLAGIINSGKFKAWKRDPERMLSDFEKYVKTMKHYLVVFGQCRRV